MLGLGPKQEVHDDHREETRDESSEADPPEAKGFMEEALPWLDAVFNFALRLTSDEYREALVLSDLGDLRYAGVPMGTVKSRLFRARRVLQEALRDFAMEHGYLDEGES